MNKLLLFIITLLLLLNGLQLFSKQDAEGAAQNRHTIIYRDANSIRVTGQEFPMQGFRFMGHYTKSKGKIGKSDETNHIVSLQKDLGAEKEKSVNNWYAVFGVLTDNNEVEFKLMPFLRASSSTKNKIILGDGGEYSKPLKQKEYTFEKNGLRNTDILFINETIDNRPNAFSGRIGKVTGNDKNSITVDEIGTIGTGDFLLAAPPGYMDYRYLGSFYVDSHEVRNISDDGITVKTRGVSIDGISGSLGEKGINVNFGGFISPLATGVVFNMKQTLSTASTGSFHVVLGMDSAHNYQNISNFKDSNHSISVNNDDIESPFSYKGQRLNLKSSGNLEAVVSRQIDVRGWIEP